MQIAHTPSTLPQIAEAKIAILQSKWYREHTDKMVMKCVEILRQAHASEPEIHLLPGSLELPLAAQTLARQKDRALEAIICFGIVVKGDTYHFDLVVNGCTQGLNRVSLDENIPIIVEVLPVHDLSQVEKRCADDGFNKGIEAALAASEIIAWRRSLRAPGTKMLGFGGTSEKSR